jgi:hypothetical protein
MICFHDIPQTWCFSPYHQQPFPLLLLLPTPSSSLDHFNTSFFRVWFLVLCSSFSILSLGDFTHILGFTIYVLINSNSEWNDSSEFQPHTLKTALHIPPNIPKALQRLIKMEYAICTPQPNCSFYFLCFLIN